MVASESAELVDCDQRGCAVTGGDALAGGGKNVDQRQSADLGSGALTACRVEAEEHHIASGEAISLRNPKSKQWCKCLLVDGAAVNPLPFDILRGLADVVVAVDCSGGPDETGDIPGAWDAMFSTLTIMGQAIVDEKLKAGAPELVIRPNIGIFRLLDFFQASAILRAAEPTKAEVKRMLGALIGS